MGITYLKGDATNPHTTNASGEKNTNIIVHICNNIGAWGAGFVLAISNKWKKPEISYKNLGNYHMGEIEMVKVEHNTYVINMIAQDGIGYTDKCRVSYTDLKTCLNKVSHNIKALPNVSIHMPRIGCGLGGGKWDTVEHIIKDELSDVPVYVYDLK